MREYIFIYLLFPIGIMLADDMLAYKIFNSSGKEASFSDIVNISCKADVVFFGELHNNPIAHWLEYRLTKELFPRKNGKIVIGAEMFESDNQLILDEYLGGFISEKSFEKEMKLWPNYRTDYKPLVEFARDNKIPFIATNIPRRYAAIVAEKGFDGLNILSSEARNYIAPLPIIYDSTVSCYKNMFKMTGMPGMHNKNPNNLPKAQAIKDATMAYFISKNLEKGKLFIHFNGRYHSDNHEGIIWYLKNSFLNIKIITITTIIQNGINNIDENIAKMADFIVVIPEDMTTTY